MQDIGFSLKYQSMDLNENTLDDDYKRYNNINPISECWKTRKLGYPRIDYIYAMKNILQIKLMMTIKKCYIKNMVI